MDPQSLRTYLDALCDDHDAGRPSRRRPLPMAATAIGLSLLAGCQCDWGWSDGCEPPYGAPFEKNETADTAQPTEDCANKTDDDGDSLVDCDDPDCAKDDACTVSP